MKNQDQTENESRETTRPLQVNDPVAYIKEGVHYQGKIESFEVDGSAKLKIFNSQNTKELIVSKEELEPLFSINKEGAMVYLKFTDSEVKAALNNPQDVKVEFEQGKASFFALKQGNKTDIVSFEKKMDDKMAFTEGRLQMKRGVNGQPYLNGDVKFKELKLERPIYGKVLDEVQQKQLKETGELGLVAFKTTGGRDFNLWVSLDAKLNKVVTTRENDIYIGKIYGVATTQEQQKELKEGKGTSMLINEKPYYVKTSAATQRVDGLNVYKEEKAKELNLIPKNANPLEEEKKNSKSKGLKLH